MVSKRLVWVALRPGFLAAVMLLALGPPSAPAAPAASFSFSPAAPLTSETVTFVSTSTGATQPQRWDLDGDHACDDATGPTAQWSFWPAGTYAVMLCVSDGTDEGTATRRFTVQNRPPAAAITFAPLSPMSGDSVTLASTSADPDGPLLSQDWDLDGDGAFDDWQGPTASVAFDAVGSHAVGLRVTDRDGAANVAAVNIPVRERPVSALSPFPVVRVAGSYGGSGIRIQQLLVKAPAGARVEVDCRGHGCPFRKLVRRARSETIRIRRFARRILRKDAVLEIWVTQAGEIGKYTRFRIRKGKPPSRVDRCVMPGDERPAPCP
jgi:hypothetical protein